MCNQNLYIMKKSIIGLQGSGSRDVFYEDAFFVYQCCGRETRLYRKAKGGHKILLTEYPKLFYKRNNYLFFENLDYCNEGCWSAIKCGSANLKRLGKKYGEFFYLKTGRRSYQIAFLAEDGCLKIFKNCLRWIYDEEKNLLAICNKTEIWQIFQAEKGCRNKCGCKDADECVCFRAIAYNAGVVTIISDEIHRRWAFLAAPPYYARRYELLGKATRRTERFALNGKCYTPPWWLRFRNWMK